MKLTTTAGKLLEAIERVRRVPSRALPITNCILLSAKAGLLTISATSLDIWIQAEVEATTSEPGAIAIPAGIIRESASIAGFNEEMSIEADKKNMALVAFSSRNRVLNINGFDAEEFPPVPAMQEAREFHFLDGSLAAAFSAVAPFVSDDPTRYVLNGAYLCGGKGGIEVVATNGTALRRHSLPGSKSDISAIIPTATVQLLAATIGDIKMSVSDSMALFEGDGWKLQTKLVEGNFPNWKQVVPAKGKIRIQYKRDEMLSAIRFAQMAATDYLSCLRLESKGGKVSIAASSAPEHSSSGEIEGATANADFSTAVGAKWISALVRGFKGEEQSIYLEGALSPCLIDDETGCGVLMVIRIK